MARTSWVREGETEGLCAYCEDNVTMNLQDGIVSFDGAVKATTGDPGSPSEGQLTINTYDNVIKIYADSAWRTLASW